MTKVKVLSLLLMVILAAVMLGACASPASETTPSSDTTVTQADTDASATTGDSDISLAPADKVEVVYFYWPQRCTGCIYAEETTLYVLESYFANELASGKVSWATYDVGDTENAVFVEKYDAYSSSLFINSIIDDTDHIEEITEIWFILGDDEAFIEVVKNKIQQSLSGGD